MKKIIFTFLLAFFMLLPNLTGASLYEQKTSETQIGWLTEDEVKVFEKKAVVWIIDDMNATLRAEVAKDSLHLIRQLKFDETKPLPQVFTERHITILDFIDIMEEMLPGEDFSHVKFLTPMFIYHKSQIVVSVYNGLHCLVHELVHYVQQEYEGTDFSCDLMFHIDLIEREAIMIQRRWQKLYDEGLDDSWFGKSN